MATRLDFQIKQHTEAVLERIENAARRVGRSPDAVTLIAVSKTFPIEYVEAARQVGLFHFGENKVQELTTKAATIPGIVEGGAVTWHMIGHLQRNKSREVVRHADLFHALDSKRLAEELDKRAEEAGRILPCLVQVNTSGEVSKSGVTPDSALSFLGEVESLSHLTIKGFMTVASPVDHPEEVRTEFAQLHRLLDQARSRYQHLPLEHLSMGMSSDFEIAIEEGATHIRLGTLLFGTRY